MVKMSASSKKIQLDEHCGFQAKDYTSDRALNDFRNTWDSLHKQFGTTYTLKIHIMLEHVNHFVEQVEGGLKKLCFVSL